MKLAVSNIAWAIHDDPAIFALLKSLGVDGIEVAPTKVWPAWTGITEKKIKLYKSQLNDSGFDIPAMQAILFGKPQLQLFKPESHTEFLDHIKIVADIAAGLGAKTLVFGSPKNRKRGQLSIAESFEVARDFFTMAGDICLERECCIAIEHNPVEYECDFVTNVADAKSLVESVNHDGFKLHIDSAGIHMCGGNIYEIIKKSVPFSHYHISESMLDPICNGEVDHKSAYQALADVGYQNWVSIEMKQPDNIELLYNSIIKAKSDYNIHLD